MKQNQSTRHTYSHFSFVTLVRCAVAVLLVLSCLLTAVACGDEKNPNDTKDSQSDSQTQETPKQPDTQSETKPKEIWPKVASVDNELYNTLQVASLYETYDGKKTIGTKLGVYDQVTLIETVTLENGQVWGKVQVKDADGTVSAEGYLQTKYLTPSLKWSDVGTNMLVTAALSVRSMPIWNATGENVVYYLEKGDTIREIRRAEERDADGVLWSYIEYANDSGKKQNGYCSSKYLETVFDMSGIEWLEVDYNRIIFAAGLNLRSTPDLSSKGNIIAELSGGQSVHVTQITKEKLADGVVWCHVSCDVIGNDEKTISYEGYVSNNYLLDMESISWKGANEQMEVLDSTNAQLKTYPVGGKNCVIAELNVGQLLTVVKTADTIGDKVNWAQVQVEVTAANGEKVQLEGYLDTCCLVKPIEKLDRTVYICYKDGPGSHLSVRSNPDSNSAVAGFPLIWGTEVHQTGVLTLFDEGWNIEVTWARIEFEENGKTKVGYVNAKWVSETRPEETSAQ